MDNYPEALAPDFEPDGAVRTPFSEWWKIVNGSFPNIPTEVAEQWLHRHWGQSNFGWMPSSKYDFKKEQYPLSVLSQIRTNWSNYEKDNQSALDQGKFICGDHPSRHWPSDEIWLVKYMRNENSFPVPPIILDNHNGHLEDTEASPIWAKTLPQELILIEGHTRLNIGLYLSSINELSEPIELFIMTNKD